LTPQCILFGLRLFGELNDLGCENLRIHTMIGIERIQLHKIRLRSIDVIQSHEGQSELHFDINLVFQMDPALRPEYLIGSA
jgi:hypothetical protein